MENETELLPVVDEYGNATGAISRAEAHNGSKTLHPVVHLHVFNSKGELFLQKRPKWKRIQPDKWDTAVGGHVNFNEHIEEALAREAQEEITITGFLPEKVDTYIYESDIEKELIYVFKTTYDQKVTSNTNELSEGKFWTLADIDTNIGKDIFTPNFESEYKKYFKCKK